MKKILLVFATLFMLSGFVSSQTVLYEDNLDTYAVDSFLGVVNPTWWTTWSNLPGSGEDIQMKNTFSHSAPMSGSADKVGGQTDAILKLGNKVSGAYQLTWWMYVETGKCGCYNIQHFQSPGTEWAFEVYFRTNGTIDLLEGGLTINGTYPKDTWFEVKQDIDLDADNIDLYINGTLLQSWPFSNEATAPGGTKQLGGVDFFAGESSGSGEIPAFFIDDVYFADVVGVGIDEVGKTAVMIYPNPVKNSLNIVTNGTVSNISITDFSGKVVYKGMSQSIDISALSNGVYFVRVVTSQGISNTKFIKN